MKLFLIKNILRDYTSGMVAIKATDLTEARKLFQDWLEDDLPPYSAQDSEFLIEFDEAVREETYFVCELAPEDENLPGVVTVVWGGG